VGGLSGEDWIPKFFTQASRDHAPPAIAHFILIVAVLFTPLDPGKSRCPHTPSTAGFKTA
jgi:hypothetical protein